MYERRWHKPLKVAIALALVMVILVHALFQPALPVAAAEITIYDNLLDANDEYGPSPNVVFISDQVGYAFFCDNANNNVAYSKTTDGGASWFSQTIGINDCIYSIRFISQNIGCAVGGGYYENERPIIVKTTDGGNNWQSQIQGTTNNLKSVFFTNQNVGWVAGYYGTINKTTDGGMHWFTQTSGTNNHLYSIFFIDSNIGWACGYLGTILKTTNGGSS